MYQILNTCKELPTTAHLNMVDFAEAFQKAAEEGYTDIIYMGLNSHGSATYQSALLGKKLFYEHLPQYADVKIHLLDSLSYSYGYGYPLVLAAARRDQGATASELVDFIQDFLRHRELYFAMYTLQFAKRSGRIGAAASFVGEMLGLKPVMTFEGGDNITAAKVRGEKNVVPRLFEYYKENHVPGFPNYVLLQGEDPQPAQELQALIEAYNGQKPDMLGKMGVCVAINERLQLLCGCGVLALEQHIVRKAGDVVFLIVFKQPGYHILFAPHLGSGDVVAALKGHHRLEPEHLPHKACRRADPARPLGRLQGFTWQNRAPGRKSWIKSTIPRGGRLIPAGCRQHQRIAIAIGIAQEIGRSIGIRILGQMLIEQLLAQQRRAE